MWPNKNGFLDPWIKLFTTDHLSGENEWVFTLFKLALIVETIIKCDVKKMDSKTSRVPSLNGKIYKEIT